MQPPIRLLVFGYPGTRKSHFVSTIPGKKLIFFFDDLSKAWPYGGDDCLLLPFIDADPDNPVAFLQFVEKLNGIRGLIEKTKAEVVVIDSFSGLMDASLMLHMHLNKHTTAKKGEHPWDWYRPRAEDMQRVLWRLKPLPVMTVVCAHLAHDTDEIGGGIKVRLPNAPGKLPTLIASFFSEVYRSYIVTDPKSKKSSVVLQTDHDGEFYCYSTVGAPNPSLPDWDFIVKHASRLNANGEKRAAKGGK
jgi:hypothetical protein